MLNIVKIRTVRKKDDVEFLTNFTKHDGPEEQKICDSDLDF